MKHPPPGKNEKRPLAAPTAGPLITDKINRSRVYVLTGESSPGFACPSFMLSQHTQSDKGSDVLCRIGNAEQGNYTPLNSTSQNCSTALAELDAEIERERARFIAAGDNDDDETFVDSFMRLLSLYESCANAQREAAR